VTPGVNGYRWVILAVGVAAAAATAALRLGLPALAPTLRTDLGLTLPQVGIVLGSVGVGVVLTLIAWGWLADRIGERIVLAAGLTGAAASLVAAALVDGFLALTAALLVAGMFGAASTGASGRAVMGWFSRAERGMALGVRQMGIPLGGGIAALALPLIVATWDLHAALLALALVCLLAAIASWLWVREPPPPPADRLTSTAPPPLRDRRLWRLATGSGMLIVGQSGTLGFIVLFLHDERGWSVAAAAAVLAGMQAAGAIARVMAGRWSDRVGRRVSPVRTITALSAVLLLIAAALAGAPTVVLLPVLLAGGVLAMSWNSLSFTAAAEISGRDQAGMAIGVQNTVLSAFGALAPVVVATVIVAASWPAAWVLLAVSQLAGVWVLRPLVGEEEVRARTLEGRLRDRDEQRRRARTTPARRSCNASRPAGTTAGAAPSPVAAEA